LRQNKGFRDKEAVFFIMGVKKDFLQISEQGIFFRKFVDIRKHVDFLIWSKRLKKLNASPTSGLREEEVQ